VIQDLTILGSINKPIEPIYSEDKLTFEVTESLLKNGFSN